MIYMFLLFENTCEVYKKIEYNYLLFYKSLWPLSIIILILFVKFFNSVYALPDLGQSFVVYYIIIKG